jgi:cytochrome c peroxidase
MNRRSIVGVWSAEGGTNRQFAKRLRFDELVAQKRRSSYILARYAYIVFLLVLLLASCARQGNNHSGAANEQRVRPAGAAITPTAPLGLPPVPVPVDNPLTLHTVALGRRLFYDRRLSLNDSISCSSCHDPHLTFTDGRPHSLGVGGVLGTRNAPTVINAAYERKLFWDGRAGTLEDQVGGPMANPSEMNQAHEVAISKLNADPGLRRQFEEAFGPGPITLSKVEQAIASFERTLISGNSPFDRYRYGNDASALKPSAIRGLAVFEDPKKGNCVACHTIGATYALFSDGLFHNLGVGVNGEGEITDVGRFAQTKRETDRAAFKTPTLRNVAESAPYMHDGSLKTLKEVVDFYAGGGNSNPYLDQRIPAIKLSGQDRLDLVEFLKSLSSELPPNAGPPSKEGL